jgi:hypothetical protein
MQEMQKKKDKETGGINNPSPKGDRYYRQL